MKTNVYTFELKSELSELRTLHQHLKYWARAIGLSEACALEINVCLDELFTNVVSYGFEDELEHPITFSLSLENDMLNIRIEDDGVPFNPLERKEKKLPPDVADAEIGGLGILITKKLMDDIGYLREGGKNKLTLMKSISTGIK